MVAVFDRHISRECWCERLQVLPVKNNRDTGTTDTRHHDHHPSLTTQKKLSPRGKCCRSHANHAYNTQALKRTTSYAPTSRGQRAAPPPATRRRGRERGTCTFTADFTASVANSRPPATTGGTLSPRFSSPNLRLFDEAGLRLAF